MVTTVDHQDYYLNRKDKYWKQLGRMLGSAEKILPWYLDSNQRENVVGDSREEFEALLSKLPYIGGGENMLTFTLVSSAAALAYIRVLEKAGLPVDETGKLLNDLYDDVFTSLPTILRWYLRWSEFSSRKQHKLKAFAKDSQLRKYPGNWVVEYIEGDGEVFDFGCSYTECAVLKFYRQMGAENYLPYVCVLDFTMSRALRTGLHRTSTLFYGGDCCDFRYTKNQLGLEGFPLENLPEYRNRRDKGLKAK